MFFIFPAVSLYVHEVIWLIGLASEHDVDCLRTLLFLVVGGPNLGMLDMSSWQNMSICVHLGR